MNWSMTLPATLVFEFSVISTGITCRGNRQWSHSTFACRFSVLFTFHSLPKFFQVEFSILKGHNIFAVKSSCYYSPIVWNLKWHQFLGVLWVDACLLSRVVMTKVAFFCGLDLSHFLKISVYWLDMYSSRWDQVIWLVAKTDISL